MKFKFNPRYLFVFIILFLIELFIALYVRDKIIRPFVGDMLVVILIYVFVRTFIAADYRKIAFGVFIFACFVEVCQYFKIVEILGLQNNEWAVIVIGTTFTWGDILAYFIGTLVILFYERRFGAGE
jgi:DNA integrity scanning protein DisA with diadenylate cyclase activity